MPVSGQYLLLSRALRGEAIAPLEFALSCVVPAILVALALAAVARRFSHEALVAGK